MSEKITCDFTADCQHTPVEGTTRCKNHGGITMLRNAQKKSAHSYQLDRFRARVDVFATDSDIYNLRGEIGILRMLIEQKINLCGDEYELMLQSANIGALINQANALVSSCHKIEVLTGNLLDKQSLAEFAQGVVAVIMEEVEPEKADKIANKIVELFEGNKEGTDA